MIIQNAEQGNKIAGFSLAAKISSLFLKRVSLKSKPNLSNIRTLDWVLLRAYLGSSFKLMAQNYLSFYLFIALLCAKISSV